MVEVGGQCYRGEGCVIKGGESSIRLQQLLMDPTWGGEGVQRVALKPDLARQGVKMSRTISENKLNYFGDMKAHQHTRTNHRNFAIPNNLKE